MSLTVPGQVPDTKASGIRRTPSNRLPVPSRKSSAANSITRRDSGLNKRALSSVGGRGPPQTLPLVRKKLPWLDGQQSSKPDHVPGSYELEPAEPPPLLQPVGPGAKGSPTKTVDQGSAQPPQTKRKGSQLPPGASTDATLRAIGSTPSLRTRAKEKDIRQLSLDSNPRPGLRPAMSKQQVPQVLGLTPKPVSKLQYTPSDYSTSPTTDSKEMPSTLPKRDPASYERLVDGAAMMGEQVVKALPANNYPASSIYWHPTRTVSPPAPQHIVAPPHVKAMNPAPVTHEIAMQISTPSELPSTSIHWQPAESSDPRLLRHISTPSHEELVHRAAMATGWNGHLPRPDSPGAGSVYWSPARVNAHNRPWNKRLREDLDLKYDSSLSSKVADSNMRDAVMSELPQIEKIPSHHRSTSMFPHPPPLRQTTMPTLPSHLVSSSSSSSQGVSPGALLELNSAIEPGELRRASESITRAVTGLENLMEEALAVARDAAQSGRQADVAEILNDATLALRKASTVHGRMSYPFAVSDQESGPQSQTSSSESDSGSSVPSIHSRQGSTETTPTLFTNSAQSSRQPVLVRQPTKRSLRPQAAAFKGYDPFHSGEDSIAHTPPALYQPPSAESVVRDFAYTNPKIKRVRTASAVEDDPIAYHLGLPQVAHKPSRQHIDLVERPVDQPLGRQKTYNLRRLEPTPTMSVPVRLDEVSRSWERLPDEGPRHRKRPERASHTHPAPLYESSYYHQPDRKVTDRGRQSQVSAASLARYDHPETTQGESSKFERYSAPLGLIGQQVSLKHPRRNHISLREGQGFSLGRHHKRQPIAREWNTTRKRLTAAIACFNTVFIGLIAGIYAGEVPRIQYQIADTTHKVILGNVLLFIGLGLSTLLFWPLPLLHGRKPYTLTAFALMLPLQFPQALAVSSYRDPDSPLYRVGLLFPRVLTGIAMGFVNINLLPTLLDLFGSSLMSESLHQEIVVADDVRRQGGGMGLWLGIWTWCYVGSLSIGFCIGAGIIAHMDPSWGFYIVIILLAFFMLVNVIAPETRRSPYRRSITHFLDDDEKVKRRVARGEVKLHISNTGPKWWFQEVWAGIILTMRMIFQPGFFVLMVYLAWIFAEVTLVILLLGALLSRDYRWRPQYVGLAALSVAIGAFFAIPLTHAGLFSRSRAQPARTDSMTFQKELTWTSHMARRCIFTLMLPIAGLAYTVSSPGPSVSWVVPTMFAGLVGFLSNLAISECVGLIMESFDTCDLQPGVNSKHRLQSLASETRRRRTNYSSFPRVCAGFFAAQSLGFFLAAACTGVSGRVTRAVGSQISIAITTAILMVITLLLVLVLWRMKSIQVIPDGAFGTKRGSTAWGAAMQQDDYWKPVIIGNPSGKVRRMNLLEMGSMSRWTEIRKLNKLTRN